MSARRTSVRRSPVLAASTPSPCSNPAPASSPLGRTALKTFQIKSFDLSAGDRAREESHLGVGGAGEVVNVKSGTNQPHGTARSTTLYPTSTSALAEFWLPAKPQGTRWHPDRLQQPDAASGLCLHRHAEHRGARRIWPDLRPVKHHLRVGPGEPSACGDLRRLYAGASGCRDHASRCAEPRPKHQVCRCPAHTEPNSYTNPSGSISAASDPHFRSTYIEQFDLPAEREFSGSVGTLSSIPLYRSAGSSSYHAMDKACMASARCWPKAGRRTASCGTPACRSPSPTSPTAAAHASPQAPATGPTCCAAVRSATSPLAAGSTPLPSRFSPPVPSVQSTTTSCTAPACSAWTCRCSRTWTCTKG